MDSTIVTAHSPTEKHCFFIAFVVHYKYGGSYEDSSSTDKG